MLKTEYRRQGEGNFPFEYYTKERKIIAGHEEIALYGWGTYGRSSVLAGQAMKQNIGFFSTEKDLTTELVKAGINPDHVNWSNKWMEPVVQVSPNPPSDWDHYDCGEYWNEEDY